MKTKSCVLICFALLLFTYQSAAAQIIYVNPDGSCGGQSPCFTHIQDAINASVAGDTVQVAAGTYIENINLKSGVVVQGAGADVTIIRGTGSGFVVTTDYVNPNTKLDGFTITGGYGGGIDISWNGAPNGTLTVSNVTVTENYGSGIHVYESDPVILNATVTGNYGGYNGGGIVNWSSSPTIINSLIGNNSASYGGGIFNALLSYPTILNTAIINNSAQYGGGIYNHLSESTTSIINSTITGNSALYGGGIYNLADNPFNTPVASLHLLNTIITSNANGGIYCAIYNPASVSLFIDYNNVWNNTAGNYTGFGCTPGPHDISADPLFVDVANGNYRLKAGSACIDAGSNDAVPPDLTKDFYGNPRIMDGDGDGIAAVDIGIAEFADVTVSVQIPTQGESLQDTVTLQASAPGASKVYFSIRTPSGAAGAPIGFDDMPASFNSVSGYWELAFDTTQIPDGYYIIFAKAIGASGDQVISEIVNFSINNWSEITLLPATTTNNAGRTMPVKFSIVISVSVDPQRPFVYNEDLEIRIYDSAHPSDILQISHYGTKSTDYRIDDATRLYITNFKTSKTPATYAVEIWRKGLLIGTFNFSTM